MENDGSIGAVCGMTGTVHAIDVANLVRRETPHTLIAGEPAERLAARFGISTDENLWAARTRERWKEVDLDESPYHRQLETVRELYGTGCDTVGAVASHEGTVVAGTSTGGRWCALAGRVGDVPQPGAGMFASGEAGASSTGVGEAIARTALTRDAVDEVNSGTTVTDGVHDAMERFETHTGSEAGIVLLHMDGSVAGAYNTDVMQTAVAENCRIVEGLDE